jgi:monoamine oxidase
VAGGNQGLATRLAVRLGDVVHLRSPVRAIDHSVDGVAVRTDAAELKADAAVLAVPLALLPEIAFRPALPDRSIAAWRRTGLAHNAKLHIPLAEKALAPASAVQDIAHRFWSWTATDATGDVQPVLHCFAGTPSGIAALHVADGPRAWAERAAELRPDLDLASDRALLTSWTDDPWARSSYSAWTVDYQPGDEELLAEPVGRLHLAGEHTAGEWAGYMEGALRSGARAAEEMLAAAR